ncbi:MAG: winged helix-turn-helix domain-containing protein [Anaeroplasmataceae bacterium]|nr:winged helix-turn-helix domain-containing protein [Anaeroplasmataceae bacterium]
MKYNQTERMLLQILQQNPYCSIDQLCEISYLGRTSVTKYLKKFKEEELIVNLKSKKGVCERKLTNKALDLLTK